MPRRAKGPRLYWRETAGRPAVWEIRDTGNVRISTGTDDREIAEKALAEYIERKNRPSGPTEPQSLSVSQALTIYAEEHAMDIAAPERVGYAIDALDAFWGDKPVSNITGPTCRRYLAERGVSAGTVRRELGVLKAALSHCYREGYLTACPAVWLPPPPTSRERWLTRQEVAWLLRAARSLNADGRHLADFILCGIYTGSRKATILALHIDQPNTMGGHIDTKQGVLYRRPSGGVETAKRRRPARLPEKYLAHIRRMAANGRLYVVQNNKGNRVADIRKGWARAVPLAEAMAKKAEISLSLRHHDGMMITPHVLKHTAITWSLQRGASIWDAAGYFSTSPETIQKVYGHHSPEHQATAVRAMNRK